MGRWAILFHSRHRVCDNGDWAMARSDVWSQIWIVLIAINLAGDIIITVLGTEQRAIVGVPIALAMLIYLVSKRVRVFFRKSAAGVLPS